MTRSITDVVINGALEQLAPECPVFFNPMGMGIFDIAIANYYLQHFTSLQPNY
jgi:ornithine cyclodeaminase/alanine dehydrogenase-like protein (mu-crystallin family)